MPRAGRLFLPLDVSYFDDDRVVELSDAAQLLDLRAMTLLKRLDCHGVLSKRQLTRIAPESGGDFDPMMEELLESGLWAKEGRSFARGGWGVWNTPETDVEAMSKGGEHGNHLRWHVERGISKDGCQFCIAPESGGESGGDRGANPKEEKSREEKLRAFESDFDECWQHYPRKEARKAAFGAYVAQRRKGTTCEVLLTATQHYAQSMTAERRPKDRILLGQTFFGPNDRYEDFIDAPSGPYETPAPEYR